MSIEDTQKKFLEEFDRKLANNSSNKENLEKLTNVASLALKQNLITKEQYDNYVGSINNYISKLITPIKPKAKPKKYSALKRVLTAGTAVLVASGIALGTVTYFRTNRNNNKNGGASSTSIVNEIKDYDANLLLENESIQQSIDNVVNFANDARLKGIDITAEEALAIYSATNNDVYTRIMRSSVFGEAENELNYYNSGMSKLDQLMISYNDVANFSMLFSDKEEIDWHNDLQKSIANYLNSTTNESRKTYSGEITSLYESRFGEGTKDAFPTAIPMDIEVAFTLKGIASSLNYTLPIKNDTYALMLKDNENINCDDFTINNFYSEYTANRRTTITNTYKTAISDKESIGLDIFESDQFNKILLETINARLVDVAKREMSKTSAYNEPAPTEAPSSQLLTGNENIQIVDGQKVIVEPGTNYEDDAVHNEDGSVKKDENGNTIIKEEVTIFTPEEQEKVNADAEAEKQKALEEAEAEMQKAIAEAEAAAKKALEEQLARNSDYSVQSSSVAPESNIEIPVETQNVDSEELGGKTM